MGKIIIYIYEGMADFEISLLMHLLSSDCGIEILVVSSSKDMVKSKSGMLYMPHMDLDEVNINNVEGLIIPGGWLNNLDNKLLDVIIELNNRKKLIAAICAAPWILAKAGVLNNSRYTTSIVEWKDIHRTFFKIDNPFPKKGYVDERVVRDGNIITAKGVAFVDFTIEVCDYFGVFKDVAEKNEFEKDIKGY